MPRFAAILIAVVLALFVVAPVVLAQSVPAQPSPITFEDVTNTMAFRDLLETGDMLVTAEYRLGYTTIPADTADVNFLVQLKDGASVLATGTPYPYNDSGYGRGILSVYMDSAAVDAAALGAWPFTGLTLRLQGNPTIFTSVPSTERSMDSGNFSSGSGNATNTSQLQTRVLQAASRIQSAWGIALLNDTGKLN